jgi:hypothetical protein
VLQLLFYALSLLPLQRLSHSLIRCPHSPFVIRHLPLRQSSLEIQSLNFSAYLLHGPFSPQPLSFPIMVPLSNLPQPQHKTLTYLRQFIVLAAIVVSLVSAQSSSITTPTFTMATANPIATGAIPPPPPPTTPLPPTCQPLFDCAVSPKVNNSKPIQQENPAVPISVM